ncbi:MAG: hypothetical protein ACTH7C_07020 [Cobetia marina]
MHDAIREAHELIGATLRDPGTQRQGRVVGMDLGREQPAIYVLWQESAAAERIDMTPDDFRSLLEHSRARGGERQETATRRHATGAAQRRAKAPSVASRVRKDVARDGAPHDTVSEPDTLQADAMVGARTAQG